MRTASIVLMSFLTVTGPALAQEQQQQQKLTVDGAWRGPGWYWHEDDMFGMTVLAGDDKLDGSKQTPFPTEAACEQRYHTTCNYYATDPVTQPPG